MPEGYPLLRAKKRGAEYAVIFRFPRFNSSVVYDPVVNIQDKPGEPELNETAVAANATAVVPVNVTAGPSSCSSFHLLPSFSILVVILLSINPF